MKKAYLVIALDALLITASELCLKLGAPEALRSGWTWCGIATYILSFLCWLYVLRHLPLSIAYGLITIVQVFVPIAAHVFLHEAISPQRWVGIACVLAGTLIVAQSAARVEHR